MRADVDGVGIEYEVTGEGRPVVLLHGFPDSGRLWREQVPALAEAGFRVIVPDMRGYGASDKPEAVEAYAMHLLVGDVLAVMSHAGAERAHVVGHDWGAAVAWVLTMVAGHSVDRLVAMSVGHPAAFRSGNLEQFQRSWYMLLFQFQGVAEQWLSGDGWSNFRRWSSHPDADQVVAELEATAALTPGLNYYRANVPPGLAPDRTAAAADPGADDGRVELGRLRPDRGADDRLSAAGGGVLALRAHRRRRPLDALEAPDELQPTATGLPTRLRNGSTHRPTAVRVVGERPVAAVLEDHDLGAWERLALALGHRHRDVGVVRAPHHQRRAVERRRARRHACARPRRDHRWRGRG